MRADEVLPRTGTGTRVGATQFGRRVSGGCRGSQKTLSGGAHCDPIERGGGREVVRDPSPSPFRVDHTAEKGPSAGV